MGGLIYLVVGFEGVFWLLRVLNFSTGLFIIFLGNVSFLIGDFWADFYIDFSYSAYFSDVFGF